MKKVRKLIEEQFSQKDKYDEDELKEDSLVKATVNDILEGRIEDTSYNDELENNFSVFKSKVFPLDDTFSSKVYAGRTVSRNSLDYENESDASSNNDSESDNEKIEHFNSSASSDNASSADELDDADSEISSCSTKSNESNIELDIIQSSSNNESTTKKVKFLLPHDEGADDTESNTAVLYSKNFRDESAEVGKGMAVKNQLNLWEIVLEYRIILQKCLVASNRLPKPHNYEKIWTQFSSEDKNCIIDCREKVWDSLEKLIQCQDNLRKRSPEFMETINKNSGENEDKDCEPLKLKRRKLTEYPDVLEKRYNEYIPYRNGVIQKWNDRTKIASGKFAKSNFSAFDQPILQQIEQIMTDKHKLIQRTCTKRSQYRIIGENCKDDSETKDIISEIDNEIFDDDDFYHKLLRDYIERKTADISDPMQLGRKWIKLQSLRSKMKRKIDTRRTKGRKIKFDVHTKLVNFMAPVNVDQWADTAINELYNSVFGKNLLNT